MSKLPQTVLQKAYLLDPSVESDNPLPVFKSVGKLLAKFDSAACHPFLSDLYPGCLVFA